MPWVSVDRVGCARTRVCPLLTSHLAWRLRRSKKVRPVIFSLFYSFIIPNSLAQLQPQQQPNTDPHDEPHASQACPVFLATKSCFSAATQKSNFGPEILLSRYLHQSMERPHPQNVRIKNVSIVCISRRIFLLFFFHAHAYLTECVADILCV